MNKKGYSAVELIVVLAVFSVIYFVGANIISKDVNVNYEEEMYALKIDSIETQAVLYAKLNSDIFAEESQVYLTVADLVNANVVISNEDGEVIDPRDNESSLNDVRVKVTQDGDEVTAEVLS